MIVWITDGIRVEKVRDRGLAKDGRVVSRDTAMGRGFKNYPRVFNIIYVQLDG